jgi:hypothetical protein
MCKGFHHGRSKLRILAAVALMFVLAISVTVELVHTHSGAPGRNHSRCSICVAAHSAATPEQSAVTPVSFEFISLQSVVESQLHSQLFIPSSFIRPPPADL